MINYKILSRSLRIFTGEYKDILRNGRSNKSMQNRACKMLKSNKNFGTTANTKTSILE